MKLTARVLSYLGRIPGTTAASASVVIIRVLAEVATVYLIGPLVTVVCKGISSGTIREVRAIFLMMIAAQLLFGVAMYFRSVWEAKLNMRVAFHMRGDVYDRLQQTGFSFHDRMSSGQLISRALSDLQAVGGLINNSLFCALDVAVTVIAYMVLLCFRSPLLMLGAMLPLPVCAWVVFRFNRKSQPVYHSQQQAVENVSRALTENVYGVHTVRACGLSKREVSKYKTIEKNLIHRLVDAVKLQTALVPAFKGTTGLTHVFLFLLAAYLICRGRISVGDIVMVGATMGIITAKLQQLNQVIQAHKKGLVSAHRLFEVLDAPNEHSRPASNHALEDAFDDGEITFDSVTFGYSSSKPVLKDFSAKIRGQKVTAIVGPTGSGKSTLVSLVGRFYDPQSGHVRIGGNCVREMDPKQIRKKVGYVFQETFLFSGTVRDNIRYGRMDVSDEMLRAAARAAHAEEFILSMSQGYETKLTDGGLMLSAGQRQRIALARALVYDPSILILDDTMAALDARTESSVRDNVRSLFNGRTVLLVASKKSTIRAADHVLNLSEEKIAA